VSDPDPTTATSPDGDADAPRARRRRWLLWTLGGAVALIALFFGAILVYAYVINDAPAVLDESDLDAALSGGTTVPLRAGSTVPVTTAGTTDAAPTPNDTSDAASNDVDAGSFDGDWVPTDASQFGYRVEEVLAGINTTAVGRGDDISGLLTIEGTIATLVGVEVLVESIESDNALRDGQFHGRIMNVRDFPTATFRSTAPIEFGRIPAGDEQVTATATGELTLRGVTSPVAFEVTAQTTDGRIGVLGSIPVVFADYGIDNPSFGRVRTEDVGLVEFVLVFERA
jgi:polyisoprenoid-binding protein YceI